MVNIWQIYFDEASRRNCDPAWNHYDNSQKLTEHFENSVIVDLIRRGEHLKSDYFGVFSHDIRIKFKEDGMIFNPANLKYVIGKYPDIDFFGFEKRRQQRNIMNQAEHYHPGIVEMAKNVLEEIGFGPIPNKLDKIVLFNYFVARGEVYERYVNDMLIPAMSALERMPEAYGNAGYKNPDDATKARFVKAFS